MKRHLIEVRRYLWLLLLASLAGQSGASEWRENLSVEVGLNYDWVGQRYRLGEGDTLDLFDEKSLAVILSYGDILRRGLWAENKATLSDRALKNLISISWDTKISEDVQLDLQDQLEYKEYQWRGEDLFGSDYMENRLQIQGSWSVAKGFRLRAEQWLTSVGYRKSTSYFRDHWVSRSTARVEWEPAQMWDLTADYHFEIKEVPDSSGLNYESHTVMSSLDGYVGWSWHLSLAAELERRTMQRGDGRQDYLNLIADTELEYDIGPKTSWQVKGDVEQMAYDRPDEIYYDFWTATGKMGLSQDLTSTVSAAVLPMVRRSQTSGTSIGETYREIGVELGLDYSGAGRWWASLSVELGTRDYDQTVEENFFSGYDYLHPTLLLSCRVSDRLHLDLMVDHEPEWHQQKEDDLTTSLFSFSLSYRPR